MRKLVRKLFERKPSASGEQTIDPDFGRALDFGKPSKEIQEDPSQVLEEKFRKSFERAETARDILELAAEVREHSESAGEAVQRFAASQHGGTVELVTYDLTHDHHQILPDIRGGLLSGALKIVSSVLSHILAKQLTADQASPEGEKGSKRG